jgi:hypothetical protein
MVDNASAEDRESALSNGFSDRRGNHCPDCFLRFRVGSSDSLGMFKQGGQQRAFLRAKNPLILHQCF